jgi:hypothetical protein
MTILRYEINTTDASTPRFQQQWRLKDQNLIFPVQLGKKPELRAAVREVVVISQVKQKLASSPTSLTKRHEGINEFMERFLISQEETYLALERIKLRKIEDTNLLQQQRLEQQRLERATQAIREEVAKERWAKARPGIVRQLEPEQTAAAAAKLGVDKILEQQQERGADTRNNLKS